MPPAFLNHRVPTACGTPTPTAASSLALPAAIAAQNRRRSSRPATGGRPGENKRTRPERCERRFRMFIATPVKVLRRPLESAQYACADYCDKLAARGVVISMSRAGNPYDNAKAERFMRTLKEEEVNGKTYASIDDARTHIGAFLENVYNRGRLHSALGYKPPAEFEAELRQTETV
ncbi:MAG: integrase core domain-containing protein [Roseiarcus sp.]